MSHKHSSPHPLAQGRGQGGAGVADSVAEKSHENRDGDQDGVMMRRHNRCGSGAADVSGA
jgi:hypothetical protein